MDWRAHLQPRDPAVASRWATALTSVAALVATVFAVAYPPPVGLGARLLTYVVPAALVLAVVALRAAPERWLVALWVPLPFAGIVAIAALDLATRDASAAGQIFLCYPVIYAAALLPTRVAWACLATAVAADATVALALQPASAGLTDAAYVGATLVTLTLLLARATDRQERLVALLQQQAAVDPLTGLVTRRVLDDAAQSALTAGGSDVGTALLMLDVDRFKDVNDTYGHPAGDLALVHVARVLAASTRPDTVICRIGGDEIALLLPGCSPAAAEACAQRVIDAIRGHPLVLPEGTVLPLSVSVGVGFVESSDRDLRALYAAADLSLYGAKRAGRDQAGRLEVTAS